MTLYAHSTIIKGYTDLRGDGLVMQPEVVQEGDEVKASDFSKEELEGLKANGAVSEEKYEPRPETTARVLGADDDPASPGVTNYSLR